MKNGLSCTQTVTLEPPQCYNSDVFSSCCRSCTDAAFGPIGKACLGEYLTTGLFVSGCYFAIICNNKRLNFVLFHKCSFCLLILKFSVKPNNKILEKIKVSRKCILYNSM